MFASFLKFWGEHKVLGTLLGLTIADASKRAVTGTGLVPSRINPLATSSFTEALSGSGSSLLSLSVGEALVLKAPASKTVQNMVPSDTSVLASPTAVAGQVGEFATAALKAGTATMTVSYSDGSTESVAVTVK